LTRRRTWSSARLASWIVWKWSMTNTASGSAAMLVGVAPEGVDRGNGDLVPPRLGLLEEPVGEYPATSTWHNVEEPAPIQVDDPRHIDGSPSPPSVEERRLVHPHRGGHLEACGIIDEREPIGSDPVHR